MQQNREKAGAQPVGGKGDKGAAYVTVADLNHGAQINVGMQLFYTPLPEEGGRSDYPSGMKFAARVSGVAARPRQEGDDTARGDWVYEHSPDNHPMVHLSIDRPLYLGGNFQKDNVPFTSSPIPGTCRDIQTEDTRGTL